MQPQLERTHLALNFDLESDLCTKKVVYLLPPKNRTFQSWVVFVHISHLGSETTSCLTKNYSLPLLLNNKRLFKHSPKEVARDLRDGPII